MFFFKYPLSQSKKGILALVTLAFGFGLIAITARYLSFQYSLFQQLYLTVFAGFLFSIFIFPRTLSLKKLSSISIKDWIVMVSRVLIGYLFAASLYREALTLTKISNVTFIQSIPFAAILGWLFFKEKLTFRKILFLVMAYIGVLIISIQDYSSLTSLGKGELFSLVSTMFFALVLAIIFYREFPNLKELVGGIIIVASVIGMNRAEKS